MKDYLDKKRTKAIIVRVDKDLKTRVEKKISGLKKSTPDVKVSLTWFVISAMEAFLKELDHFL